MKKNLYVLNGPNLNMIGLREPEIYGSATLADVTELCHAAAANHGFAVEFLQSDAEHELIGWIHDAKIKADAIIINPAAYSHTSIALLDALKIFQGPVAEVHLSNIHQREIFRHHSYISMRADCVICGCGIYGYQFAIDYLVSRLEKSSP